MHAKPLAPPLPYPPLIPTPIPSPSSAVLLVTQFRDIKGTLATHQCLQTFDGDPRLDPPPTPSAYRFSLHTPWEGRLRVEQCTNVPTMTVMEQPTPNTHSLQWSLRSTGSGDSPHPPTRSLCDYTLLVCCLSSLRTSSMLNQGLRLKQKAINLAAEKIHRKRWGPQLDPRTSSQNVCQDSCFFQS